MRKVLLVIGILLVLALLFMFFGGKYYTKQFSPEGLVVLTDGKAEFTIFYNKPAKRGRKIFGGLVPFGKVWRTGANEATWFETNTTLRFGNAILKPDRYSLWTIPGDSTWTVILNSNIPPWGRSYNNQAAHDPQFDVLKISVPVQKQNEVTEQFTIAMSKTNNGYNLILTWDKTVVEVPFSKAD